ncbi:MAG: GNAT family N-acetyltransferase [Flavisolibacter sp.]|nr:GNAT family N-acetyltransferase [Flavisolibacter sp.]
MEIKQATEKEDFLKCWEVVRELRPHLDQEQYLTLILYMIDEGYKMIYIEENGKGVAFCGYRLTTMLHRGRSIYIDDLCTLPEARGQGHAKALLDYVLEEARAEELQSIHLDSGHHRHDAHRLYLNFGFKITSHHFVIEMK